MLLSATSKATSTDYAKMAVAFILTCDPSLTFSEATEIASRTFTTKNGLEYVVIIQSDDMVIGVSID